MKIDGPIDNVIFISEVIEKVIAAGGIEEHLEHNDFHFSYQSASQSASQ